LNKPAEPPYRRLIGWVVWLEMASTCTEAAAGIPTNRIIAMLEERDVNDAAQQPYVFVSYASADQERVFGIVDQLDAARVRVWIDREGIYHGAG
jgi:malate/lactate dehydrogenase